MPRLPPQRLLPDGPRRAGGQARRGLPRGEQGALRRRHLLLMVGRRTRRRRGFTSSPRTRRRWRRGGHDARASRGCPRSSSASRASSSTMGAAGATAFTLQLTGESTERLAELSHEVAHSACRPCRDSRPCVPRPAPAKQEVQVIVNRDRASQLGLTTQQIASTVAGAMRGDRLPELRTTRARDHHAPRVPRERPPVGRRPRQGADHARRRLAHRARRGRRLRGPAERPRRSSASTA